MTTQRKGFKSRNHWFAWQAGAGVACVLAAAGCSVEPAAAGDVAAAVAPPSMQADAAIASPDAATTSSRVAATANFEGTMQVLELALEADAVRAVVGSTDPGAVLAFPPEQLVDAALAGDIEARSIRRSTLEIDGGLARWQAEGESTFMVVDGQANAVHVVTPDTAEIMTMDPAGMAAAGAGGSTPAIAVEQVGQREIRGFDANGYRVPDYMGETVLTLWLSPELEAVTGPIFDVWATLNPLGQDLGQGVLVRSVMVNPEVLAGGDGYLPAYTVAEFHDPKPGPVAGERLALPEGYTMEEMP